MNNLTLLGNLLDIALRLEELAILHPRVEHIIEPIEEDLGTSQEVAQIRQIAQSLYRRSAQGAS